MPHMIDYIELPVVEGRTESSVVKAILLELDRAQDLHRNWPADPVHAAAIVAEECGELVRAVLRFRYEGEPAMPCDREAIETAAMCIRFLLRK